MNILFIIDSFRMGGAEKSLATLLNCLPAEGHDIEVMCVTTGHELERMVPSHVKITRLDMGTSTCIGRIKSLISRAGMRIARETGFASPHPNDTFWRFMKYSVPKLNRHYDVAVAYQQGFPTAYLATKVNASRKIAWVNADISNAKYDVKLNLPFYRKMDAIVTVSGTLGEAFIESYGEVADKVRTINDIVDTDTVRRLSEEYDPYASSSENNGLRLLTVARLEHVKGIDLAIEASRILRDKGIAFHWHFLGEGNLRPLLESLIDRYSLASHVTLHGTVTNPYPWMRGCDIYIQPSRREGYGIALVEAMTLCRPVIATDYPVAHEHIDSTNGLVAPISPQGIAEAVIALSDINTRNAISRAEASCQNIPDPSLNRIIALLS